MMDLSRVSKYYVACGYTDLRRGIDGLSATSKAAIGYEYCNKLFALERKFSEISDDVRKIARQVKVEPLLEAYCCG